MQVPDKIRRNEQNSKVSAAQIKQIHTLKSKLGWDDDFYRQVLAKYGVESSKEMSYAQRNELIAEMMKASGGYANAGCKCGDEIARNKLNERGCKCADNIDAQWTKSKVATKAQVYAIVAIWGRVSRAEGSEAKRAALDSFIDKKFGKKLETLSRAEASKVIVILKKMEEQHEKKQ